MAYITRTTGSSLTNQKKFTYSAWLKIGTLGSYLRPIQNYYDGNNRGYILFCSSSDSAANTFFFYDKEGGTLNYQANTTAKFRDTHGWYHLVYRVDTTQSTQADRVRIYINGEQQSMSISTNVGQNVNMGFNSAGSNLRIGGTEVGAETWNGVMSHVHFCDGYSYAPTEFGETDSTTGEWKIKTSPSVTYGNNGFWVFKDDASVTDRSGEGNNFTVSGDVTKTEDCPSNVYATANPLVRNQVTITTANLTVRSPSSNWMGIPATMGVSSGKYYWEYKLALGNAWSQCGVMSSRPTGGYNGIYSTYVGNLEGGLALNSGNGDFYHNGSSGAYSTSAWFSGGLAEYDIIGVALDATNSEIWFSKNGTWGNSSNPSTGSGGIDFSGDTDFTNYKPYFPAFSMHNCILTLNFGNGYLGTSEITTNGGSGFQDADGNGRFYYAVPTNFRCLSTKGLNQ